MIMKQPWEDDLTRSSELYCGFFFSIIERKFELICRRTCYTGTQVHRYTRSCFHYGIDHGIDMSGCCPSNIQSLPHHLCVELALIIEFQLGEINAKPILLLLLIIIALYKRIM